MFAPSATYRIQFHKDFTFRDLLPQIPYLKTLGIDTIYASPIFKARPGSTHGYDVTNALELNLEIGNMEDLQELQQKLRENQMYWLQDIVPNHMAFHQDNVWLMDIFEKGPASAFYNFFDINWEHPAYTGKLMAPFLGTTEDEALKNGDVKLTFTDSGFKIQFYENQFPASLQSWPLILKNLRENGSEKTSNSAFEEMVSGFEKATSTEFLQQHKTEFLQQVLTDPEVKKWLDNGIENLNKSPEKLKQILDLQYFRLELWSVSDQQINYRRFFTINELICLRMDDPEVFRQYHAFISDLYRKGFFQGLRIDHIDGLGDPFSYLQNLRKLVGPECYITVEKILALGEELPEDWPVQGTTGYFFLAIVNQLLTSQASEKQFDAIYEKYVSNALELDYEELVFEKKNYMLENHMQGELDNLFLLLQQLELLPETPGYSDKNLKTALQILLAAYPVYRLYVNSLPLTGQAAEVAEKAFARAEKFALHLKKELQWFYKLLQADETDTEETLEKKLQFLKRCQQFTGPLAAKGVEDTTFYNFNRLISHNEVGDDPEVFGISVSRFHKEMQERQQTWNLAQNATATHDTKRGEDARLRLNALTEFPDAWNEMLQKWQEANKAFIKEIDGQQAPSPNRIFFLYQALLGAFPMQGEPETDFLDRIKEAMTKAMREAKMYSNWSEPNEDYENETHEFLEKIFAEGTAFRDSFERFVKDLSFYGMLYSLGQTLLKITAPGIPDIYQGCELWDLSMVDPDNRRPVDYGLRQKMLSDLQNAPENGMENTIKSMLENWRNGSIKLFVTTRALHFRKENLDLFLNGDYLPLEVSGNNNVVAFARKNKEKWCLVLAPLSVVELTSPEKFPLGEETWQQAQILLPPDAPENWINIFTKESISGKNKLSLAWVFKSFPVAFLTSNKA